jgi:hypothetical protein
MRTPEAARIIGEMIFLEKYKFVDNRLLADIVETALKMQQEAK